MLSWKIVDILFNVSITHNIYLAINVRIVCLFFNKFLTDLKVYSWSVIIMEELQSRSVAGPGFPRNGANLKVGGTSLLFGHVFI